MPAGSAFTTQLNKVWVNVDPGIGPELVLHTLAAPVTVQFTVPAGAFAPLMPVTVAVNVIVPPNAGLADLGVERLVIAFGRYHAALPA